MADELVLLVCSLFDMILSVVPYLEMGILKFLLLFGDKTGVS